MATHQQNALEVAAARLECKTLRRELSKDADLENKERAAQLCTEGHKNRFGHGVPANLLRAFQLYTEAGSLGDPDALTCAGILLEEGLVDPDIDYDNVVKDLNLLGRAAKLGHADAQVAVGYACEQGRSGWMQDHQQAIFWYTKAAEQGSATATNNLASLFYHGRGCQQDFEKAAELFKKAAAGGNTNAVYNLGVCYEFGRGVAAEDSDKALQLYQRAAQAGHVKAACALGLLLFKLNVAAGKPVDAYIGAAKWLRVAAEHKDVEACFGLGQLFEAGLGVSKDYQQALEYYRTAAAAEENPKVHLRLAHLLYSGHVGGDLFLKKEAFRHYQKAAEDVGEKSYYHHQLELLPLPVSRLAKLRISAPVRLPSAGETRGVCADTMLPFRY
ncbi:putative Sel1 repeat domain-containing protein [Neospora caninum Liverpool]|uniref:Putative Sel1 repeat domain-containing protein n=1 Tax=Neospora caninum (strain Liverpool) TaxID=572307 RepID=F0VGL8_NEOCL|nr:putative Sel1 repeat domain-containing protein [Neospora caninum Liverpool]CBZ52862.1 putative Sel1 repeat domain-containing protein [Neospora caninum Liverpool]|eukprot:XP_003882894.1 putative Sel1 repeat domain-containing protein [Neospora caninum Liverpool]